MCRISGRVIGEDDKVVMFTAFVWNEADPLMFFSDGAFLAEAFNAHPLASTVLARYEEHKSRTGPGNRICMITGKEVQHYTDHLGAGFFTDDPSDPLHEFNYLHLSRAALEQGWSELPRLVRLLEELRASDDWKGAGLDYLISELRRYLSAV